MDDYYYEDETRCSSHRDCTIDGCPPGCCGWGVSREPYWNPASISLVAPCGATPETEILPMVMLPASSYSSLPAEIFAAIGRMCEGVEMEYWESIPTTTSPSSSPPPPQPNEGEGDVATTMVVRNALEVNCTKYLAYSCDAFPLSMAIITRPNRSSTNYSFIVEPITFNDGDSVVSCTADSTPSWTTTSGNFALLSLEGTIIMFLGGILGVVLLKLGVCNRTTNDHNTGQNQHQDLNINGGHQSSMNDGTNPSTPVAIPASIFDFVVPPPTFEEVAVESSNTESVIPGTGATATTTKKSSTGLEDVVTSLSSMPGESLTTQRTELSLSISSIVEINGDEEV